MPTHSDKVADRSKSLEVLRFSGEEWVRWKMRHDPVHQIANAPHLVLECLVAAVRPDGPALEVLLHQLEYLAAVAVLADRETGPHLPSSSQRWPRGERDGEATLSIHVTGDVRRNVHQSPAGVLATAHSFNCCNPRHLSLSRYGVNLGPTMDPDDFPRYYPRAAARPPFGLHRY